jgi:polar amino acid transport system substrate-binding protein
MVRSVPVGLAHYRLGFLVGMWACVVGCASDDPAQPSSPGSAPILVAISPDIPPYVMQGAATGLEVEIVARALDGHTLKFTQLPYAELETAVENEKAQISVGVQQHRPDTFYSGEFITFANFAISKKSDGLKIDSVADLAGHKVFAWQDAYLELGPEFKAMFSPDGPERANYEEVADQIDQVRKFWEDDGAVIVIDRAIFDHFSQELGHKTDAAACHALFPPVTNFKVAFRDEKLRDHFNEQLKSMCQSGEYAKLLEKYEVELERTICEP